MVIDPEALPILSAEELHTIALRCRGTHNRVRYVLLAVLRTLSESRKFLELGFPSIAAYAEKTFGHPKTTTYEALRVAEALEYLPRSKEVFLEGSLSWTALRQIARVAATDTEEEWLEFARKHGPDRVQAEVQDAYKKKRSVPRAHGYGLPNLETQLKVSLTLSELEIVQKGFDVIAEELSTSLGGDAVKPKDVLLFLAERALATTSRDPMEGKNERQDPHHNVVYQQCPECLRSQLATASGMVEVSPEVVACVEGDAHREELPAEEEILSETPSQDEPRPLDPPNSARLSRKVRLRDGLLCSNPNCCRAARHSHHVKFRSHGGRTALFNEVAVCEICHALIHQGRLRVTGSSTEGFTWSTRSDETAIDLEEDRKEIAALPVISVPSTRFESKGNPGTESAAADSSPERESAIDRAMEQFSNVMDLLPRGIKRLRREERENERFVRDAIGSLIDEGVELSLRAIVNETLRPGAGTNRLAGEVGVSAPPGG